ncbi:MAG: alanine racemase [Clostridia bacterium]|nr:MAG: alanine racemase [Clostridia bacterium]
MRPVWAEVDLRAIKHNLRAIRGLLAPGTGLMAVVKANAYGHGLVEVSRAVLEAGASWLGVAIPEEAAELRAAGVQAPILVLGYTPAEQGPEMAALGVSVCLSSMEQARAIAAGVQKAGLKIKSHIKIDTGMGRLGFLYSRAVQEVSRMAGLPGLEVEGIFTHFAAADAADTGFAREQLQRFRQVVADMARLGLHFRWQHAANSAAVARLPESHFNLVRPGIMLYGCSPLEPGQDLPVKLQPAMSFRARIAMVKEVPPGTPISYGCTYVTGERARIATLPVGYADGYSRGLSNCGQVLVDGNRIPVVGRVCMDHVMVDVSRVAAAGVGQEVILWGPGEKGCLPVEEVADKVSTISYELLCAVGPRVPRVYRE